MLDERRVKRGRRYVTGKRGDVTIGENNGKRKGAYGRRPALIARAIGPAASSAQDRVWRLEIRQSNDQYTEFFIEHRELENQEVPLSSPPAQRNDLMENGSSDITGQPPQYDPIWLPDSPSMANMPSPQLDIFCPAFPLPQRDPGNIDEFFRSFLTQDMSADLPFLGSDAFALACHSPGQLQPQWTQSKDCIESMLRSISQEPECRFIINHKYLDAQDILDKLESPLPDDFFEGDSGHAFALISRETISMSKVHKRIIFSIANNFAGFQNVSPATILKMLRIDPEISSFLFEGLRSDDLTIAKPLADNLFRAAIEAGDEEAVGIIFETTSGRMNKIHPNRIVCQFRAYSYTPIALASHLHHYGIVQKLLGFGAKVSVASKESDYLFTGCALAAIVPRWHWYTINVSEVKDEVQDNPEVIRIVELLLANGAEISIRLLKDAIRTMSQSNKLVEILVQAVPRERHHELFDSFKQVPFEPYGRHVPILYHIVEMLEDQLASKIIRNLINICQIMNCTPACSVKYSQTLDEVLFLATLKGNFVLAEYLLGHIQPTIGHLTAAIRSGRPELIDLMLKQGICVRGEAVCFDNMSHSYENCHRNGLCHRRSQGLWTARDRRRSKPTSPLAEAIRLQDSDLIRRLEHYGALDRISDKATFEFQAAAFATAEVDDFLYLKQLLTLVPPADKRSLTGPIEKAIEMGHAGIAKTLIIHGARDETGNDSGCSMGNSKLLLTALKKRNREIVEALLEYFTLYCWEPGCQHSNIVEEAVRWGEKSIVEDLLKLGLLASSKEHNLYSSPGEDTPESALGVAITTRNAELTALLLEWGADPSELGAAIKTGDEGMMRLLLHHGADPADGEAFSVISKSSNSLLLPPLFEAFSSRYPNGKKGFGWEALTMAILSRDTFVLDKLLKLKLDVNSSQGKYSSGGNVLLLAINHSQEGKVKMKMNQMIHQLLDAGADPEARRTSKTALLKAIEAENLEAVKLLLSSGADVNRPARRGLKRTPLQQACEQGSFQMVEFLLDNSADVHAPPAVNGGATALQLAAIQGSVRIVRLLLDKGADIHAAPAVVHGRTSLEGAAEHGRVSVLNILLAEGAAGYGVEEIKSAKTYAEKEGHRGCEERLKLALFRFGEAGGSRALLGL